jgi:hypothetical protein
LHQALLQLPYDLDAVGLLLVASSPQTVDAARPFVAAIDAPAIQALFSRMTIAN